MGEKSSIGEKVAYAESIAGLQLAFARQTSFAARSFSCRELDFYCPIIWGCIVYSAGVSQQTSIEFHYASDLPLFALYANANHVLGEAFLTNHVLITHKVMESLSDTTGRCQTR